nr:hypothetical protein [Tanacetum cinerariifolium]
MPRVSALCRGVTDWPNNYCTTRWKDRWTTGRGGGRMENKLVEVVDELVNKVDKEVTEVLKRMEALTKSLTSPQSSLSNCKT